MQLKIGVLFIENIGSIKLRKYSVNGTMSILKYKYRTWIFNAFIRDPLLSLSVFSKSNDLHDDTIRVFITDKYLIDYFVWIIDLIVSINIISNMFDLLFHIHEIYKYS